MPDHSSSSPSTTTPPTAEGKARIDDFMLQAVAGFDKTPGKIHALMATWVEGHGWLVTRRGAAVCGPDIASIPEEEMFMLEMRGGYRAIKHRLGQVARGEIKAEEL